MGVARVECRSGCSCEPSRLDGTWGRQVSLQQIHMFKVGAGRLLGLLAGRVCTRLWYIQAARISSYVWAAQTPRHCFSSPTGCY